MNISNKTCPECGASVVVLIMDNATGKRFCHYCHGKSPVGSYALGMDRKMTFDEVTKEMRETFPGRVTTVSYAGMKFAMECGIDVWEFAETYSLQAVIRDFGTPAQKQRLKEEILAGRLSTDLWWEQVERGEIDPDSDKTWEEQLEARRRMTA